VDTGDQSALARLRHAASTPMAVVLDTERWGRGTGSDSLETAGRRTAELLTAQGWRAVAAGPTDDPAAVWQRLGLSSRRRRAPAPAPTASEGVRL
jgi:hypothetical protein